MKASKKMWYGLVYRHWSAHPVPVLSTIIQPACNLNLMAHNEKDHPQDLPSMEMNAMEMEARSHRDQIGAMFVEFKSAKWWLEIFEVGLSGPTNPPQVIRKIEL